MRGGALRCVALRCIALGGSFVINQLFASLCDVMLRGATLCGVVRRGATWCVVRGGALP